MRRSNGLNRSQTRVRLKVSAKVRGLHKKAAEDCRTPRRCRVVQKPRSWSAAVLCRFSLKPVGMTESFNRPRQRHAHHRGVLPSDGYVFSGVRPALLLLTPICRGLKELRIPKGFRHKAQGCEERATLGKRG